MARWRGQFARSRVSGHTDACTQVDAGGRWGRFWTIEKRRWDCAGCRAQSARVWEGDGATAQAVCRPWVSGSHRCLHTYWRGRSMGQIFDHRETVMGAALAGAHSLRESRGAMARRRRLLFDLNAVAYMQSTNTLSMRSPNANLIYLPSRVSQVSCEDGQVFVEGQLTTSAYAC